MNEKRWKRRLCTFLNGLSNIQEYGRLYVIQMEKKLRLNLFKMAYDMLVKKSLFLSDTGIVCNTSGRRITGDGEKFMYG